MKGRNVGDKPPLPPPNKVTKSLRLKAKWITDIECLGRLIRIETLSKRQGLQPHHINYNLQYYQESLR